MSEHGSLHCQIIHCVIRLHLVPMAEA